MTGVHRLRKAAGTAGWALAAFVLCSGAAYAAGSTAMDAFNFVTGARAAGMGGAVAASVNDVSALQWNPAALAGVSSFQAVLSHLFWIADINYSHAGVGMPVPMGYAGVSVQALDYGTIESTKGLRDAVSADDLGVTGGWGLALPGGISGGISVKYFRHVLADAAVSEAAADVGSRYELIPDTLGVAVVVQNVGYSGKLEGKSAPLPTATKMGVAYRFRTNRAPAGPNAGGSLWEPEIFTMLEADVIMYQRGEPAQVNAGVEFDVSGLVFARAGYLQGVRNAGSGAGMSVGVGFRMAGLGLDYAYGSVGDLGNGQYVTLSWTGRKP